MEKLKVTVVTPDRMFYDEEIDSVKFYTTEGYMEVLYNHIPITTSLESGIATFRDGENEKQAVIHRGFVEVQGTSVSLITYAAEWSDDIDITRAKKAKDRALEKIKKLSSESDEILLAEAALRRALARIELADKK